VRLSTTRAGRLQVESRGRHPRGKSTPRAITPMTYNLVVQPDHLPDDVAVGSEMFQPNQSEIICHWRSATCSFGTGEVPTQHGRRPGPKEIIDNRRAFNLYRVGVAGLEHFAVTVERGWQSRLHIESPGCSVADRAVPGRQVRRRARQRTVPFSRSLESNLARNGKGRSRTRRPAKTFARSFQCRAPEFQSPKDKRLYA